MKQGGESFKGSKAGVRGRFKCNVCGRHYKMAWAKDTHERLCKEYERVHGEK